MVILANKHDRERPELGEVEGLADLALVGCAVSVQGKVDSPVPGVFVRKCDARPQRNLEIEGAILNTVYISLKTTLYLGPYDPVTPVEVLGVHVHAAALPLDAAAPPPCKLGQDAEDAHPQRVGEAVSAVTCDHGVLRPESGDNTCNEQRFMKYKPSHCEFKVW